MPAAADQPLPTATGKLKAGSHRRKRREMGKLTVATVTSTMLINGEIQNTKRGAADEM